MPEKLIQEMSPDILPWLLALLALVVVAATLEGLVQTFWLRKPYDWRAYGVSLTDAVGRRAVDALGLSIAAPVLYWAYQHRIASVELSTFHALLILFFGQEFFYYWYHRTAHRVRWFWATHCVHHSPNELTLASALRLGWTGKLTGTGIFFAPLVWAGFPPLAVAGVVALNLLYQFWLHAVWIPKLGVLEWVLNTPSHHRVHHGSNPEYLDRNYGGVLIIFDRLFGTYAAERDDFVIRYGLTTPLCSYNPLRVALHGWIALAQDVRQAAGWRARLRVIGGPPASRVPASAAAVQRAATAAAQPAATPDVQSAAQA